MDHADITQARQEAEDALRARYAAKPQAAVRQSHCNCGEPIPEVRQAYGFTNCIDCAEVAERGSRRR